MINVYDNGMYSTKFHAEITWDPEKAIVEMLQTSFKVAIAEVKNASFKFSGKVLISITQLEVNLPLFKRNFYHLAQ